MGRHAGEPLKACTARFTEAEQALVDQVRQSNRQDYMRACTLAFARAGLQPPEVGQDIEADLLDQLGSAEPEAGGRHLTLVTEQASIPQGDDERFLYHLSQVYRPELAAELARVPMEEVGKWKKSKAFRALFDQARALCLASVEHDLLRIGRGAKGNASALTAWLEANTLEYGLVRREFVRQKVDAVMVEVLKILREELTKDQFERFRARFRQILKKGLDKLPD